MREDNSVECGDEGGRKSEAVGIGDSGVGPKDECGVFSV